MYWWVLNCLDDRSKIERRIVANYQRFRSRELNLYPPMFKKKNIKISRRPIRHTFTGHFRRPKRSCFVERVIYDFQSENIIYGQNPAGARDVVI